MTVAFAPSTAFGAATATKPTICVFEGFRKAQTAGITLPSDPSNEAGPVDATVTMRCRRDLKKEKQLRNQQFARVHRKRVVKNYNRRAAQEAITNEDNDYLSSIYGTIRFRKDKDEKYDK